MIVYGANCVWWDSIEKASSLSRGPGQPDLPCCPHCKCVLFQMEDADWDQAVKKHTETSPGYDKFVAWLRGKCFPTSDEARVEYMLRDSKT